MNGYIEKRECERYIIGFSLEVSAHDPTGKKYRDKTVLKNISREGARFVTKLSDKYYMGQRLKIAIHLPGTDKANALMTGEAIVVQIDRPDKSETNHEGEEISVAIKIDSPFYFKKTNIKPS